MQKRSVVLVQQHPQWQQPISVTNQFSGITRSIYSTHTETVFSVKVTRNFTPYVTELLPLQTMGRLLYGVYDVDLMRRSY